MIPTRTHRPIFELAEQLFLLPVWDGRRPAVWLEAMCLQESSGNPLAVRYEPGLDKGGPHDPDTPNQDDGVREDDKSYGLMQVLGSTYKEVTGIPVSEHGLVRLSFQAMFNPFVNVGVAIIYIQSLLRATGGDVGRMLARYNGGGRGDQLVPNGDGSTFKFRNQAYVDRILHRIGQVEADRLWVEQHWGNG